MPDSYALFGYPVQHSWSPFIHGLFARQTGQDMLYRLHEAPPDQFRHDMLEFFFEQGGCGANVTLPHKRAAAELVNELTPRAQLADAVNTVLRRDGELIGDNTDGAGLVTDLRQNLQLNLTSPRILMLGAGGAARGALGPLLELNPSTLVIANRTANRAIELAEEFSGRGAVSGAAFDGVEPLDPFDLIINATSASLKGAVPPIHSGAVDRNTVCYDMAYGIGETPFTRWALDRGVRNVAQGWGMLVEQAAEAFFVWRGVRPQTPPVLQALHFRANYLASAARTRS
ncbi:MAG: shikimate dehydrogenase [Gammaproteobacteria bacterium]|nr:shikimate dehydrogenase [Gammaproteobacteria bacterium]MDH4311377.1 shikimate dehydrogenase [Gammaproteobacteria bacterium]MDH5272228.1 shikimate dehydrogenase [Gammaproteobacteria bacterium]